MKYYYRFILLFVVLMIGSLVHAQEPSANTDSLNSEKDSLVQALLGQIQELQMQSIMMREQLEKSGEAARSDSLRLARRKSRIDSLRNITPGAPLIIEGDTLFILYNRRGGITPEARVEDIYEKIMEIGTGLTLHTDSIYIFDADFSTDIMAGNELLMSITDFDGLWQNKSRQELAADYCKIIEAKIQQLHAEYGLKRKLIGVLYVIGSMVALGLLIWATNYCYRRWRYRLLRRLLHRTRPLTIKDYEVLNLHRQGVLFLTGFNVLRWLVILMLLFIFVKMNLGLGSLLLAHTIFNVPYVILTVLPKLKQFDQSLYEAALDLGASPSYAFRKIVLPEILPGIVTGALFAFTLSIDDFVISFFTTGSGVNNLSILIYSMARRGIHPTINALSTLLFLVVLVLLLAVNRRVTGEKKQKHA